MTSKISAAKVRQGQQTVLIPDDAKPELDSAQQQLKPSANG